MRMGALLLSIFLGSAAYPAGPSCPPAPPEWCDSKMVHFRISDDQGDMAVGQENGTSTHWKRKTWTEALVVSVRRRDTRHLLIEVRREGAGPSARSLKTAILSHGQSLALTCGVELPSDFLRGGGRTITFTDDE